MANRCGWSFKKDTRESNYDVIHERHYNATGLLQLSAGQEAGAEAAIHAMWDIFANEDTEAVLLIAAENAFNFINRKVLPYLNFICPIITTYITNCYITHSRLFIIGRREILSKDYL